MKYHILTIMLSMLINIVSARTQNTNLSAKELKKSEKEIKRKEEREKRYIESNNKINKKIRDMETKRQRDILVKLIETHEIRVNRRNKAREERIIRDQIAEYKRKSDQDDKITKRKTNRIDRKSNNAHLQEVKDNKKFYGTKESRNKFKTNRIENSGTAMNSSQSKKRAKPAMALK